MPSTLLVRGLDGQGPGDIVGAFAGEAEVDPEAIGDIDVEGDQATVELADADAARAASDAVDRVGSADVEVVPLAGDRAAVREYVAWYSELVERERETEMERHEREMRSLSGPEREAEGRAVLGCEGRDAGEGLGGHRVKFVRRDGLPDLDFGVGDLVMVSKRDPLRDDNPTGTVAAVTGHSVTVSFGSEPPGFVYGDGLRLDLYVNDVTYQRMLDALEELPTAEGALADLRAILVGEADPEPSPAVDPPEPIAEELTESQREAVRRALGSEDVHLIHGPPGTGKTTTAVETVRQCVARGDSVLATAASNTAVDNLVAFLDEAGVDAVRVGHPARVTPALREHTLDARVEAHEDYQRAQERREEAFEHIDKRDEHTAPSGRWRRGLPDERIRELAEEGRGARGVPAEKIEEMAVWLRHDEAADERFEEADRLEEAAVAAVLDDADVVCATNSTAGSDLLAGRRFDTVVLDEATQATEPSCLIPLVRADRVVLAGDHRQLPPTVRSRAAARGDVDAPGSESFGGLRETLFERLADRDGSRSLLRTQFRMHEAIQGFPSRRFYGGGLEPAPGVAGHTLADLGIARDDLPAHREALDPEAPVTFVDTAGVDAPERSREGSTSRENPTEADLVAGMVESLLAAGLPPEELAVVSPYDDQVRRLREAIDRGPVAVDTVDGFQGREKEVVLVSLVRSNERGEVGFLADERRFNVALTRARRKAVVVGDATTVGEKDVYADFLAYVRERPECRAIRL